MRERMSRSIAPAALTISILALVVSTTGLAAAALGGGEAPAPAATAAARRAKRRATRRAGRPQPKASTTPRAGGLLLLNTRKQFPASVIPKVRAARSADRLGGRTLEQLQPSCAPTTVDVGTLCIDASPYPIDPRDAGDNNWMWASRACVEAGGRLPRATELIGAAARVKLASTVGDSELTASVDEDPTDGLKDQREMTADLITTTAGASAAGSQGVSDGSRGDPRQGEPDPVPFPANPTPETLQYLTVYDNGNKGGFAGTKAITQPETFRCVYAKEPGAESRARSEPPRKHVGVFTPRRFRFVHTVGADAPQCCALAVPVTDESPLRSSMSNPRLATPRRRPPAALAVQRVVDAVAPVLRFLARDLLTTGLLVASVALAITFFLLLGSLGPEATGDKRVSLSTVTGLADADQLRSAKLLDHDHQVEALTETGLKVYADYPASDAATLSLMQTLEKASVPFTVDPQSGKPARTIVVQFLLPILLLVCLFAFFTRLGNDGGAGGIASFSNFRGKGKKKKAPAAAVTFDSVAGAGEALAELKEIRDFLADPSRYLDAGAAAPKGVLLVGPPGTGKTLLARATAGEADAAFFSASGAEFVESLVGVGAARVRDLFAKARRMAPAIIFIDELDAAGRKRGAGVGQGNDEREQTLNQLLVEMDGFGGDAGLVVMAATNRPDILDPALLRPGRFDRQVVIDVPDVHGRFEMLTLHARGRSFHKDVDLMEIAQLCPGFSGAELANVVNEAALLSVREGSGEIDQATLEESIDRVVAGPAKKHVLTEDERWTIAVHEAGHAVATRAIGQTVSSQKLSIVARGRQLGTAAHMLTDRDAVMHGKSDLERQLVAIMAGTAGEVIEFGEASTGVSDDLHAATRLARSMVTSFGMSPRLGPVTIGEPAGEVFLGASLQELGSIGQRDAQPHRRGGRADRRGGRGARRARAAAQLDRRARRRPARWSSSRRSPASRSTRCCRRSSRSSWTRSRCRRATSAAAAATVVEPPRMSRQSGGGRGLWPAVLMMTVAFVAADFLRQPLDGPDPGVAAAPGRALVVWVPSVAAETPGEQLAQAAARRLDRPWRPVTARRVHGGGSATAITTLLAHPSGSRPPLLLVDAGTVADLERDRRGGPLPAIAEEAARAERLLRESVPIAVLAEDPLVVAATADAAMQSPQQLIAAMRRARSRPSSGSPRTPGPRRRWRRSSTRSASAATSATACCRPPTRPSSSAPATSPTSSSRRAASCTRCRSPAGCGCSPPAATAPARPASPACCRPARRSRGRSAGSRSSRRAAPRRASATR